MTRITILSVTKDVVLLSVDGVQKTITWALLTAAASQEDRELAARYSEILRTALAIAPNARSNSTTS